MIKIILIVITIILSSTWWYYIFKDKGIQKEIVEEKSKEIRSFRMYINTSFCEFEMKVNDITVFDFDNTFHLENSMPINFFMKDWNNSFTLKQKNISQKNKDNSNCNIIIKSITKNWWISEEENVIDLTIQNWLVSTTTEKISLNEKRTEDSIEIQTNINLNIPAFKWKWVNSDIIKNTEENKISLFNEYKKFHNLLKEKKIDEINMYENEKLTEHQNAFSLKKKDNSIIEHVLDKDLYLYDLDPDIEFEILWDWKLARITRWDGAGQIAFVYNDDSSTIYYDLIYRKEWEKWILTR